MNRLRECREKTGLTQKQVAVMLKIKGPSVSNWERGKTSPSRENVEQLAKLYGVSMDHLMGIDDVLTAFPNAYPMPAQNHLPIYGAIKCGPGGLAMEELLGYAESVKDPATHFCLMCYGDSMLPEFKDGDIVVNKFSRYLQVVSRRLKAGCLVYLYSAHIAKRLVSWSWVLLGIGSN